MTTSASAPLGPVLSARLLAGVRERLAWERWDLEQTQLAIAEADRGEFATREEMQALFARYGSQADRHGKRNCDGLAD